MPQPRRRAGFAQKTKPRRFITEILFADDLQRHRASEIDVERFVGDPHCTATKLDRFPVFARHQFIMLKSLYRRFPFAPGRTGLSIGGNHGKSYKACPDEKGALYAVG